MKTNPRWLRTLNGDKRGWILFEFLEEEWEFSWNDVNKMKALDVPLNLGVNSIIYLFIFILFTLLLFAQSELQWCVTMIWVKLCYFGFAAYTVQQKRKKFPT